MLSTLIENEFGFMAAPPRLRNCGGNLLKTQQQEKCMDQQVDEVSGLQQKTCRSCDSSVTVCHQEGGGVTHTRDSVISSAVFGINNNVKDKLNNSL